jgi:LmbE family N-acetylglucosaminyl deacetylase
VIIMVLSPHRDDAAFSLGLSIDAWLLAGHTVSVLNFFTQSAYAPFSDVDLVHANDRTSYVTALRRREDLAWNKLTGNKLSFHDLDLLDAPLRLACSVDEVLTAEIRAGDRAVARVEGALAKISRKGTDSGIGFAVPLAVGGHIDHRVVRQAALSVLNANDVPILFYEDLPYAARQGESEGLATLAGAVSPDLRAVLLPEHSIDAAMAVRRKHRIAECYDSQVDSVEVRSIASFAANYGGRERVWANAAALESALTTNKEVA